jgi:hypothetical protein
MLLGDPSQNPFSTVSTRSGHRPLLRFSGTIPESFLLRADEVIE